MTHRKNCLRHNRSIFYYITDRRIVKLKNNYKMKRASINECGREADIFILRRFTGRQSVLRSKIRRPKRTAAKAFKRSIWSAGEKRPINQKLKRASINECGREADIFILRRFTGRQSVLRSKIRRPKKTAAEDCKRSIWSAGEK